jgi:hypothetical protein
MFQMSVKTAWDDYFTGNPTLTQQKEFGTQQTPSATGVYVLNCLFKSITAGSNGGALSCTSATEMLVESSSFFSIRTSGQHGGAIFFSNSGGQCVLNEVCGYDCHSTYTSSSFGQFARINVYNVASSKNYVNYSSITRCINDITNSHRILFLCYGKNLCESVNISMNKCYYQTGFICEPFVDSNYVTGLLSYSSFVDNIATNSICIEFWRTGGNFEIKSCNILRNTQANPGTYGMIITIGNLMIKNSCILENNATYIYGQYSSYTITLSNCTVDLTSNNGKLLTQNTVTKSFILALNHMSTRNCHSGYDSVGVLTPITPHPPSSNKQKVCYTCVLNFCQSRLRDFISLLGVFIINFIHFDISNDPLN